MALASALSRSPALGPWSPRQPSQPDTKDARARVETSDAAETAGRMRPRELCCGSARTASLAQLPRLLFPTGSRSSLARQRISQLTRLAALRACACQLG